MSSQALAFTPDASSSDFYTSGASLSLPSWSASVSFDDGIVDNPNPDETIQTYEAAHKTASIILIDANPSMWLPRKPSGESGEGENDDDNSDEDSDDEEPSMMEEVLVAVVELLKSTIIMGQRSDRFSVVFFASDKHQNDSDHPGVFVYHGLETPAAPLIKDLIALTDKEHFDSCVGSASQDNPVHFHNALWACSAMFGGVKSKTDKRILIFTNRNDPTNDNSNAKRQTDTRLGDLDDQDVELDLYPLHSSFDPRGFWANVVTIDEHADVASVREEYLENFDRLKLRMRKRAFHKRALAHCNLEVASNLSIAVKFYCLIKPCTVGTPKMLDATTNLPLTCKTSWLSAKTGYKLAPHEIKTYAEYARERVFFTKDEMKEIKDMGVPGLKLFGFKSMSKLMPYHQFKQPYFVYPDEESVVGSTLAFNALLIEMHKLQKFALCRLIYRRAGGAPRFVALLPQIEELDIDGAQLQPPGFHMVFLPYADDIRDVKTESLPIANDELVKKAKRLVNRMVLDGSFVESITTIPNPSLQQHYTVLEAIALDEEVPDEMEDELQPNYEAFEKVKPFLVDFKETVYGDMEPEKPVSASKKRKRAADDDTSGVKKPKKGEAVDWTVFNNETHLKKLTMDHLKSYLRTHKLPLGGKKADLIERVLDHMAE